MQDTLSVRGELLITLRNENGHVILIQRVPNLVVSVGLAHIAARVVGNTPVVMSHMELGTGSSEPAPGDTALESRIVDSRTALTSLTANDTSVIAECEFGPGIGTGTICEAGIFNASSAGTMMCRTVFLPVNKSALDTLTIQWYIVLAA